MPKPLILATRKSPLALAQTRTAAAELEKNGIQCLIKTFSTAGDEIADKPLADIGGKELFINNLRRALKDGAADIAVHSAKDMPAKNHPEFSLLAVGFAEDPRDVFISQKYENLRDMPEGATVGTCSPRRAALLAEYFPKVNTVHMRGNVQTRLNKLKAGACDGVILAAAGLRRLNLIGQNKRLSVAGVKFHCAFLNPEVFIPAPGQGVLALEYWKKNKNISAAVKRSMQTAANRKAHARRAAEAVFAAIIGGDCRTPLGCYADGESLHAFYAGGGRFCKTFARYGNAAAAAKKAAREVLQPGVWVSRPARRVKPLAAELKKLGLRPVIKPALRIAAPQNAKLFKEFAACPQKFDMAIFVSEEAVWRLQKLPPAKGAKPPAFAVGPATLKSLANLPGFAAVDAPAGDGDALLKLPQLQTTKVNNKKIAVLGGVDGGGLDSLSPKLCGELRNRGAEVFPIAAYRRLPPSAADIARAADIVRLMENRTLRAAVAYSGATAAAMLTMAGEKTAALKRLPLFVIHPNIAAAAKKMGYENVHVAPAADMARRIAESLAE